MRKCRLLRPRQRAVLHFPFKEKTSVHKNHTIPLVVQTALPAIFRQFRQTLTMAKAGFEEVDDGLS
jgi:hypothetical protein